jgi:hypothetical protein
LVYPLLLGKWVPTYYSCIGKLVSDKQLVAPDVVFIQRKSAAGTGSVATLGDLVSLRFFDDSKTLIVSGVPCDVAQQSVGHDEIGLGRLYTTWQEWFHGVGKGVFCRFPTKALLSRYGIR